MYIMNTSAVQLTKSYLYFFPCQSSCCHTNSMLYIMCIPMYHICVHVNTYTDLYISIYICIFFSFLIFEYNKVNRK